MNKFWLKLLHDPSTWIYSLTNIFTTFWNLYTSHSLQHHILFWKFNIVWINTRNLCWKKCYNCNINFHQLPDFNTCTCLVFSNTLVILKNKLRISLAVDKNPIQIYTISSIVNWQNHFASDFILKNNNDLFSTTYIFW